MSDSLKLLAIVEQGGYPNFTSVYQSYGYKVTMEYSMRKALAIVRKEKPDAIVAEFNFQSDFRDRTSTLESLLATVEGLQQSGGKDIGKKIKVLVFFEVQYQHQLEKLQAVFSNFRAIPYPIEEQSLKQYLS